MQDSEDRLSKQAGNKREIEDDQGGRRVSASDARSEHGCELDIVSHMEPSVPFAASSWEGVSQDARRTLVEITSNMLESIRRRQSMADAGKAGRCDDSNDTASGRLPMVRVRLHDKWGDPINILCASDRFSPHEITLVLPCRMGLTAGCHLDMEIMTSSSRKESIPVSGTIRRITQSSSDDIIRYIVEAEFHYLSQIN